MASNGQMNVVVLWESELRAAGQALISITADAKKDSKEFSAQVIQALNACSVALAGVNMDNEAPMVVLGNSAIKHVPREITIMQKNMQNKAQNQQIDAAKKRTSKPQSTPPQAEKPAAGGAV